MAFKKFTNYQLRRMMHSHGDFLEPKVNVFWPDGTTSEHRLEWTRVGSDWEPSLVFYTKTRGLSVKQVVPAEDVEIREEDLVRAMLEDGVV